MQACRYVRMTACTYLGMYVCRCVSTYVGMHVCMYVGKQVYGDFLKMGYPKIIHFSGIAHCKVSILGYLHLWEPPYRCVGAWVRGCGYVGV